MKDKEKHIDPEVLISKYLAGEATNAEIKQLEQWVLASEENKTMFRQAKQSWNLSSLPAEEALNVDDEWKKLKKDLFSKQDVIDLHSHSKKKGVHNLWRIAAVFLVLIAAAIWIYQFNENTSIQHFNSGETVSVNELSDGSIVSLNQDSEIKFKPAGKESIYRNVELKGDAFFEVKPDKKHPFLISADELEIKVLGTSFYVDAREDRSFIEVTVQSGSVSVKHELDSLVLLAGQKAIYDRVKKQLSSIENDDVNFLAWKTKILTFEDEQLLKLVDKLNDIYKTDIKIGDQQLKNCKITVTFKDQDIESILRVIEETMDLQISRAASQIILTGNACE